MYEQLFDEPKMDIAQLSNPKVEYILKIFVATMNETYFGSETHESFIRSEVMKPHYEFNKTIDSQYLLLNILSHKEQYKQFLCALITETNKHLDYDNKIDHQKWNDTIADALFKSNNKYASDVNIFLQQMYNAAQAVLKSTNESRGALEGPFVHRTSVFKGFYEDQFDIAKMYVDADLKRIDFTRITKSTQDKEDITEVLTKYFYDLQGIYLSNSIRTGCYPLLRMDIMEEIMTKAGLNIKPQAKEEQSTDEVVPRHNFFKIIIQAAVDKYISPKTKRSIASALEYTIKHDILPNNEIDFGQNFRTKYLYNNYVDQLFKMNKDILQQVYSANADPITKQITIQGAQRLVMKAKEDFPGEMAKMIYVESLVTCIETGNDRVLARKQMAYPEFLVFVARLSYFIYIDQEYPFHSKIAKTLALLSPNATIQHVSLAPRGALSSLLGVSQLVNKNIDTVVLKSKKQVFLRKSIEYCLQRCKGDKEDISLANYYSIIKHFITLSEKQVAELSTIYSKARVTVEGSDGAPAIRDAERAFSYINIDLEADQANCQGESLYQGVSWSVTNKRCHHVDEGQFQIDQLLPLIEEGQGNKNFIQAVFKLTYNQGQNSPIQIQDFLKTLIDQQYYSVEQLSEQIDYELYKQLKQAIDEVWKEAQSCADGLEAMAEDLKEQSIDNRKTQKLILGGKIAEVRQQFIQLYLNKHILIQQTAMFKLQEFLLEPSKSTQINQRGCFSKLMFTAINQYHFLINLVDVGGSAQHEDESLDFERQLKSELSLWVQRLSNKIHLQYANFQSQACNKDGEVDQRINAVIKSLQSNTQQYSWQDAARKVKEFYINLGKDSEKRINFTDPSQAIVFISENMPQQNCRWVETMKHNMHFYENFQFEPLSDLLKMKSKIENYQVEKQDKYGWQYVKGYVKCAFYFNSPDRLIKALEKFAEDQYVDHYTILQVNNRISTPCRQVSLVVYHHEGRTVGKVYMKIQSTQIPQQVTFLDHWLYRLRRIYDQTSDDNLLDWTKEMKKQRIKEFGVNLQNITIQLLNKQCTTEKEAQSKNVTNLGNQEDKYSQTQTKVQHKSTQIDIQRQIQEDSIKLILAVLKSINDLMPKIALVTKNDCGLGLSQLKDEIYSDDPTSEIIKSMQAYSDQFLKSKIFGMQQQLQYPLLDQDTRTQLQAQVNLLHNIIQSQWTNKIEIQQYIGQSFDKHFQKVKNKFDQKLSIINQQNKFKEYQFKLKVKEFEVVARQLKKHLGIQSNEFENEMNVESIVQADININDIQPSSHFRSTSQAKKKGQHNNRKSHDDQFQSSFFKSQISIESLDLDEINLQSSSSTKIIDKIIRNARASKLGTKEQATKKNIRNPASLSSQKRVNQKESIKSQQGNMEQKVQEHPGEKMQSNQQEAEQKNEDVKSIWTELNKAMQDKINTINQSQLFKSASKQSSSTKKVKSFNQSVQYKRSQTRMAIGGRKQCEQQLLENLFESNFKWGCQQYSRTPHNRYEQGHNERRQQQKSRNSLYTSMQFDMPSGLRRNQGKDNRTQTPLQFEQNGGKNDPFHQSWNSRGLVQTNIIHQPQHQNKPMLVDSSDTQYNTDIPIDNTSSQAQQYSDLNAANQLRNPLQNQRLSSSTLQGNQRRMKESNRRNLQVMTSQVMKGPSPPTPASGYDSGLQSKMSKQVSPRYKSALGRHAQDM